MANIIVRTAYERRYTIVLEELGKKPVQSMIKRMKGKQLRHRIFQASFRGTQRAVEEEAKKYGAPVIHVNPKNTSRTCPIHGAPISYGSSSRVGKCSKEGGCSIAMLLPAGIFSSKHCGTMGAVLQAPQC